MNSFSTSYFNSGVFLGPFIVFLFFTAAIIAQIWLLFSTLLAFLCTVLLYKCILNTRRVPERGAVLITGCSSGIGEDAAVTLAGKGILVFATVRKPEDAERLSKLSNRIVPVLMDVTKEETIHAAVRAVRRRLEEEAMYLHAIVNNAGYGEAAPLELLPLDALRRQLDVNVVGVVAVSQAFLPLLRKGPSAAETGITRRLINISAGVSRLTLPTLGAYCASKHALEAITDALRMELRAWNINVASVIPGSTVTGFRKIALEKLRGNMSRGDVACGREVQEQYGEMVGNFAMDYESSLKQVPPSHVTATLERV